MHSPTNFNVNEECKNCHLVRTPEGHDPCIANLPGVVFACCGHGQTKGYLKFNDGRVIDFHPIRVYLDEAEYVTDQGVPVYTNNTRTRVLQFKSSKIRKMTSGFLRNTEQGAMSIGGHPVTIRKRV